jgi:hypothetical protein
MNERFIRIPRLFEVDDSGVRIIEGKPIDQR